MRSGWILFIIIIVVVFFLRLLNLDSLLMSRLGFGHLVDLLLCSFCESRVLEIHF